MIETTLSNYIGVPSDKIARLLKMKQQAVYADPEYQAWINRLDANRLHQTLPHARAAYEKHLPHFIEILHTRFGMSNTPMSAFTLGNWLVGFLQHPEAIGDLSRMHSRIPSEAFRQMLPDMIEMLNDMPQGRAEWQNALALMALPLVAPR
jgi:hypothetical protein